MNDADIIRNLESLASMLPKPGSGAVVCLSRRALTHYDPEIEALHLAIQKFKLHERGK